MADFHRRRMMGLPKNIFLVREGLPSEGLLNRLHRHLRRPVVYFSCDNTPHFAREAEHLNLAMGTRRYQLVTIDCVLTASTLRTIESWHRWDVVWVCHGSDVELLDLISDGFDQDEIDSIDELPPGSVLHIETTLKKLTLWRPEEVTARLSA